MSSMPRHLMEHPQEVSIVRLPPGSEVDWPVTGGPFHAVLSSADETSVVCPTKQVPAGAKAQGPYAVIEVAGPLTFGAVGVFVEILGPLADAGITVLVYSTFDTDWVLVPADRRADAANAWRKAGLIVTPPSLTGGPA